MGKSLTSAIHDEVVDELIPSEEYVRWAYRLLLGREPECPEVVTRNPLKNDRQRLIETFLNSLEFRQQRPQYRDQQHPYGSWDRDAVALIHIQKTGGTTLHSILSAQFSENRTCPERFNGLHSYSPAELSRYDFFSGHFDYFVTQFIPRRRVRRVTILRDPCKRLISWYRFTRSRPVDDLVSKLAKELSAEEFFEHEHIVSSTYINNTYLFVFGSSLYDHITKTALVINDSDSPFYTSASNSAVRGVLAQAITRVCDLDAIVLTEQFEESAKVALMSLGFPIPTSVSPLQVTDKLPNLDEQYSRVPPVSMTPRLARALEPLTVYDKMIYQAAKREFENRRAESIRTRSGEGEIVQC